MYNVFRYETGETYTVTTDIDGGDQKCICHNMEFEGISCTHLIAFLNHSGCHKLPDHLIKLRWTKGRKNGIKVKMYDDDVDCLKLSTYMELSREANDIINDAISLDDLKEILLRHFQEARQEMQDSISKKRGEAMKESQDVVHDRTSKRSITRLSNKNTREDVVVRNPPQAKTKDNGQGGRPRIGGGKRWKSDMEYRGKKPRKCKKCDQYNVGHDSCNCLGILLSISKDINGGTDEDIEGDDNDDYNEDDISYSN